MIISQKILRNVSLTAHPQGCARYVEDQIKLVKQLSSGTDAGRYRAADVRLMPKRVLVVGGSTGYGLSSRIVAAFAGGSGTINVSFEREPSENKTATPGWYQTAVFERLARAEGLVASSVFGDAFSDDVKQRAADEVAAVFGQIDLMVFSVASPLRIDAKTGVTYRSVIKPVGEAYEALSVDVFSGIMSKAVVEPADEAQVAETVKVMGGEPWMDWVSYLSTRGLLARGFTTVSYSYIGPEVTYPIYREGTIGKAKEDLERTAHELSGMLVPLGGRAFVAVNKALVTRASAVIPVVPLYIALLYRVMKERGLHEQCTHQMYRLFNDRLYAGRQVPVDPQGRIRMDDWEMSEAVQREVQERWAHLKEGDVLVEGDLEGFRQEYANIHGFGYPSIDYEVDVDPRVV